MAPTMKWVARKFTDESEEKFAKGKGGSKPNKGSYSGKATWWYGWGWNEKKTQGETKKKMVWQKKVQENPVLLGSCLRDIPGQKHRDVPVHVPAEKPVEVQTIEKIVEIPDAPAQVVEQMIAGEEHPQVLPPQVVGTMAPTQMAPVTVPAVPEEGLAVKGAIHLSMQAVVAPGRKSCLQDSLALEWYEDLESDADGTESDFDLDLLEAEDDDKEDSATTEWFDHLSGAEWWNAYAPFHIEDYC